MLIQVEISNPQTLAALEQQASARHKPLGVVIGDMVENQIRAGIEEAESTTDLEYFRRIREKWLAERGGRLFSDSAEIIRESRENDW